MNKVQEESHHCQKGVRYNVTKNSYNDITINLTLLIRPFLVSK